ncbi:hypothetical protein BCU94_04015 [Shewanella sp. 10N.286.52.C2]|uniref:hypothetical protein n=1 Tax=Shewanella sp. 10N.286.48.A6 TaxID=1880833 RepID=UPI000C83142C|nr:hypothetical protein [Shewanella sp. 5_MG-2023]MDO6678333.1 hypothetical protein [Shewanella sp. 4_MG-2023]PMG28176.1 hypothetical protein BCU94_04015 [Shewanella sp. 10N.286.52.C2]PMG40732.1 hypothetical protein BCU91_12280 [Shewanella sp. 10N.286.52.B9]PMH85712.1 hypothetical protein BCU57_13340 [Shewanella sp. 10N.286.48.B5]PMI03242.1 hypothetical protein BCU55_00945 [Shewanella sp. 10N.286.48.A6]
MVKAVTDFLLTRIGRVVFTVCFIVVSCISVLMLEQFADTRDIWAFDCQSDLYEFSADKEHTIELDHGPLFLALTVKNKQIQLNYYNAKGSKNHEYATFDGDLTELEVGDMTYKLDLVLTDAQFNQNNSYLRKYLAKELKTTAAQLQTQTQLHIAVQVLEMDIDNKYILMKFKPYNMLWACRLHE